MYLVYSNEEAAKLTKYCAADMPPKSMDKNIVELEGNVTRDVEMKEDAKYCFISIAVGRQRGSGSDFISVKAFGEVAKSCAGALKKGDRVAVTGYVSSSSFTPKGTTEKVYRSDIVVGTIRKIPKGTGFDVGGFIDESQAQAGAKIISFT